MKRSCFYTYLIFTITLPGLLGAILPIRAMAVSIPPDQELRPVTPPTQASGAYYHPAYVAQTTRPIPPSYVRLEVYYFDGSGGDAGAGATIDTNVVLSHNHHLLIDQTPADIQRIVIKDVSDNLLHIAEAGEFLMAGDAELGGGLSLFVFKANLFKALALLGDVDALEAGMLAEQAVFAGAKTRGIPVGLYPVTIDIPNGYVTNQRATRYRSVVVSHDLTTSSIFLGNDSGAPLYINNVVYGVNNSGNGIYGAVTDIRLIRNLIVEMNADLRGTR